MKKMNCANLFMNRKPMWKAWLAYTQLRYASKDGN